MQSWCLSKHKSWLRNWLMMTVLVMIETLMVTRKIQAGCIEEERKALLEIKASLLASYLPDVDPLLPTWVGGECCDWERVKCDTTTGHVTDLYLSNMIAIVYEDYDRIWPLNISLFLHFKEITSLNLSYNYLDDGSVSTELGRLSGLKKLEILDLSGNDIGNGAIPSLAALTSLRILYLSETGLGGHFPAHEFAAFKNLEVLDLTYSDYYGTFQIQGFEGVPIMKKLKTLNLGWNNFNESLIASLSSALPSLETLDLHANALSGSLPAQDLAHLTNLKKLDLAFNGFNRTPSIEDCKSLLKLKRLESISLVGNNLNKSIISCLSALPSLKALDLGGSLSLGNSFPIQEISSLRELETLDLSRCGLVSPLTFNGTMSNNRLLNLNLDSNNVSEDVMRSMAIFPSLTFLSLVYCNMGGKLFAKEPPNLPHLKVLILRGNHLNGTLPMEALSSFHNLEVLDLSGNSFTGSIPSEIQALSSLKVVSFAGNKLNNSLPVPGLCELKNLHELDLSSNMFDGNLPQCFNSLSSLKLLDISSNQFTGMLPPSLIANLTSLEYIDFSHNKFQGSFSFSSFADHTKLEVVQFESDNDNFTLETEEPIGWIPMFQLKVLVLSNCNINRPNGSVVPGFLLHQHKLRILDLSHNSLKGQFPNWLIKHNTMLEVLNLRNNSFGSIICMLPYRNANTWWLDLSGNHMIGTISSDTQKFLPYMTHLNLSTNALDGAIPTSFGDLSELEVLDLSDNEFSGEVPKGLFTNLLQLDLLKLSMNKLHGHVLSSNLSLLGRIGRVHLDSNCFTGQIGNINLGSNDGRSGFRSLTILDIGNNFFTGLVPGWISNMSSLSELVVRNNSFDGRFPCGRAPFSFLDISQNSFSGPIPSCLNWQGVQHLYLGSNRFTGSIPKFFGNMTSVLTLDVGNNSLSGGIPKFLGELSYLTILLLRKNNFSGSIPNQLCQLSHVRLIDLSSNSLSGLIPDCLQNIIGPSDFAFGQSYWETHPRDSFYKYRSVLDREFSIHDQDEMFGTQDEVQFTTKALSLPYKGDVLDMMLGLDLSCNKLTGKIPEELGLLTQIHALNLSHNLLTGQIPLTFSNLANIESLDLSSNSLTGKVPSELIKLKSLAVFNVSYNNLSGRLPEMKAQFSTFTKESYKGNPLLCGPPLEKKCTTASPKTEPSSGEEEGPENWYDINMACFYGSFSSTLVVFMLGIAAILYTNPYWCRRWLDLVEECMYTCYYFLYDSLIGKLSMIFRN